MARQTKAKREKVAAGKSGEMKARWLVGSLALGLFFLTLGLYLPVTSHAYVNFDDDDYVFDNPQVTQGLSWVGVKWAFTTFHACNWHPLTWLSHMTDVQFFGLQPGPAHGVNVLFHAVNTVLVFLLLWHMTGFAWRGVLVAGLFAWHPLHVESVAWIAERKDVLSACLGFLTLLAYVRFARETKRQGMRYFYFGLALWLYALGLMAKPMLVTWPFVLLLLDIWPLGRMGQFHVPGFGFRAFGFSFLVSRFWSFVWEKIPFFVLALLSALITCWAQKSGGAMMPLSQLTVLQRLANTVYGYCFYVGKLLWPQDLMIPYHSGWDVHHDLFQLILGAIFLGGVSIYSVIQWPKRPWLAVGWFWFLGTLVPVIGLVQVGGQSAADRYMYLPSIGLFLVLVWLGAEGVSRWRLPIWLPAIVTTLLLSGLIFLTWRQQAFWKNGETLVLHSFALDPDSLDVGNSLAWTYATDPDPRIRNGGKAVKIAEAIVKMTERKDPYCLNTLAVAYAEVGRYDLAIKTAEEALNLPGVRGMAMFVDLTERHLSKFRAGRSLRTKEEPPR
jgi:hypothetical protein